MGLVEDINAQQDVNEVVLTQLNDTLAEVLVDIQTLITASGDNVPVAQLQPVLTRLQNFGAGLQAAQELAKKAADAS